MLTVKTGNKFKAGPGQRPPSPQPTPKVLAPTINYQSIYLFVGTDIFSARIGVFFIFKM